MSWTTAVIDGVANTYRYATDKFRTPRKAPPYIAAELDSYGVPRTVWGNWNEEKRQLVASRISWIYSNIVRIGNEVSAADFQVFKYGTHEKDIEHPFEKVMRFPNEFFGQNILTVLIF